MHNPNPTNTRHSADPTTQIQSKYTPPHGQDPKRTPYNTSKSITCQVGDSLASSLKNLRHFETGPQTGAQQPYIDCQVLHSPFPDPENTQEAWRAMELHVPTFARTLGLSNVYDAKLLDTLWKFASTKPAVLQNRFYPGTGYDTDVRAYCAENGITYQSFWTLTANPGLLRSDVVADLAEKVRVSEAVALYALVLGLGKVSVLNGTTNAERMREDVAGVQKVAAWAEKEAEAWREMMGKFRELIAS